jgi:lipopolysaccharide export system permease protein
MRKLFFYLLRQIFGPFLLFTLLLTLVVWMTQSLRLLDLVINRGQSPLVFTYLTLWMVPSLLVIIVPIAFFGAAIYTLNKLNNDSELVVMWSAGVSRAQLSAPVLTAAATAMTLTYACSLYLMPLGQRLITDKVFDIRADIGTAILREGAFTTPTEGLTVFIREIAPNGVIRGILVHDAHDPARPVTYIAQTGILAQTDEGPRLIMENSTIEQSEQNGSRLTVLKSDRSVLDLDQYTGGQRASERDTSERFLSELFNPQLSGPDQDVRRGIYRAEAHNRLSAPLYCILFALIALAATTRGHMGRSSYALRLSGAALAGAALRLVGYGAQGIAAKSPALAAVLYLVPLAGIGLCVAVLSDAPLMPERFLRIVHRPAEASAP